MTRVSIICRGSVDEGLGHVVRASSVGLELVARGADVAFTLIGDVAAERLLGSQPHFDVRRVSDDRAAVATIDDHDTDLVVFDTTHLDAEAFAAAADGRLTASLSPIFDRQSEVDIAFVRTRYGPDGGPVVSGGNIEAGLEWTVVRPDVMRIEHSAYVQHLYAGGLSVGIAMGGADAANLTLEVIRELDSVGASVLFWVMLGEGYAHSYEDLVEAVRTNGRHEVVLARTGRSMWTVLQRCSLVVLAGGVTTYEAAYAGLPSINLLRDERWQFLLRELVEAEAVEALSLEPGWGTVLRQRIESFESDRDRLFLMHRRARQLVDGRGAARIAERLLDLAAAGDVGA